MTQRPTNREIADALRRTWRFRWWEFWNQRTVEPDMVAEIINSRRQYLMRMGGDAGDWSETYGAQELRASQCRAFGFSPMLWLSLASLVIQLLRWWEARNR